MAEVEDVQQPAGAQQLLGDEDAAAARRAALLQEVTDIIKLLGDAGITKPKVEELVPDLFLCVIFWIVRRVSMLCVPPSSGWVWLSRAARTIDSRS